MKRILYAFVLCIVVTITLSAQNFDFYTPSTVLITGQITSEVDGTPISGATVTAISNNADYYSARSNPFGYYVLEFPNNPGYVSFHVTAKRYVFYTPYIWILPSSKTNPLTLDITGFPK